MAQDTLFPWEESQCLSVILSSYVLALLVGAPDTEGGSFIAEIVLCLIPVSNPIYTPRPLLSLLYLFA